MNFASIKNHLSPYSIHGKRTTTINHAFASALAPYDDYEVERVIESLTLLGQDASGPLKCVYCDAEAGTWDHLVGLVEKSELRGFGHQIGNLVPCCKPCNSKKGSKKWEDYLRMSVPNDLEFQRKRQEIMHRLSVFATEIDITPTVAEETQWRRYSEIKQEILLLMQEADRIAVRLRPIISKQSVVGKDHSDQHLRPAPDSTTLSKPIDFDSMSARARPDRKQITSTKAKTVTDLNRLLAGIGKMAFVSYFDIFCDSSLSNKDAAERLPGEYTLDSRLSRVSKSRRILREGLAEDALMIIAESNSDAKTVGNARRLLTILFNHSPLSDTRSGT